MTLINQTLTSVILYFACSGIILGQSLNTFTPDHNVPVIVNHVAKKFPWAGGMNNPQFSPVDLNNDGFDDLFVYEKAGDRIYTFLNDGIQGQISYSYAPKYEKLFPQPSGFALLRDFNCDGKPDLFTQWRSDIRVYRNISESDVPVFQLEHDVLPATIFDNQSHVYNFDGDVPAIEDVTGDGYIDIITYSQDGTRAQLYENKTADCETLEMHRQEGCWGYFREGFFSATLELQNEDCLQWRVEPDSNGEMKNKIPDGFQSARGTRHTGTSISVLDLTGNGLQDVLIGDVDIPSLIALYNTGTQQDASMTSKEDHWPDNSTSVDLPNRATVFSIDVNNNGKKEIIAAPARRRHSKDFEQVWLYSNSGTQQSPDYTFTRNNFLIRQMMNFGTSSFPRIVDVDGDGLDDLITGSAGYFDHHDNVSQQTKRISKLTYYQNTGSEQNPEFTLVTDDFGNLEQYKFEGLFPDMADLDNDGDLDLIAGTVNGRIIYCENTAAPNDPPQLTLVDSAFLEMPQATYTAPLIHDLNKDGKLDLIIGNYNGELNYFENKGTASNPQFQSQPDIQKLGDIQYRKPNRPGYTAPFITNYPDSTSSPKLFIGTNSEGIRMYEIPDDPLNGSYTLIDSLHVPGEAVTPVLHDLNNNGKKELIYGQLAGGLSYMSYNPNQGACCLYDTSCVTALESECNELGGSYYGDGTNCETHATDCEPVGISAVQKPSLNVTVHPNPFHNTLNISIENQEPQPASIRLYSLSGRLLISKNFSVHPREIQLSTVALKSGVYLLKITSGAKQVIEKIIKHP